MKKWVLGVFILLCHSSVTFANTCERFLIDAPVDLNFSRAVSTKVKFTEERHRDPSITRDRALSFIGQTSSDLMKDYVGREIKSVFYPAAGNDAITAFKMFSDADFIVGLDSNPFVDKKKYRRGMTVTLLKQQYKRDRYDRFEDVGRIEDVSYDILTVVLTDLKFHYPEIIIESIEVLNFPSERESVDYALGGKIEFREKKGGPLKTYMHIQLPYRYTATTVANSKYGEKEEGNDIGYAYLVEELLRQRFDVVMAKASMSFFQAEPTTDSTIFSNAIGPRFIKALIKNKGVFVNMDMFGLDNVIAASSEPLDVSNSVTFALGQQKGFLEALGKDNKGMMYLQDEASLGLGYVFIENIKITVFPLQF